MTFDAKSLLHAPLADMTVDSLAAALAQLQATGMGGAGVCLPGGAPVRKLNLAAHGEQAAHFVLSDGVVASGDPMLDLLKTAGPTVASIEMFAPGLARYRFRDGGVSDPFSLPK